MLPAFAAALVVFALAWVSLRLSGMQQQSPLSLAGIFLIALCAVAYEFFSRLGFRLLGLNKQITRRNDEERAKLRTIISAEEEKRQEFELALLDIGLPVMNGYELGERLRSALGPAAPKLVAVTGYGLASDHAQSKAAGFVGHLVKPLDLDAVQVLVRNLIGDDHPLEAR